MGTRPAPALTAAKPDPADPNAAAPAPPAGAMYTILCTTFAADTHISDANRAKAALIRSTGLKDFYCFHTAQESDLYYGYYVTFEDRTQVAEYKRAQEDRTKLSSLTNESGDQLFPAIAFVTIESADPPAPKEWDLASCKGFWTLQIGVYKDSPQRKQAAVDAVREARAQGVEAYFHHGSATSEVCVGSWPREAVKEGDSNEVKATDPNKPLLYLSNPIQGAENGKFYTRDGQEMTVIMPKLEILDPSLKAAIAQYPYTLVNGVAMGHPMEKADHTKVVVPEPSYLIQVPHDDRNGTVNDANAQNDNGAGQTPPAPDADPDPMGIGHLKSIGQ